MVLFSSFAYGNTRKYALYHTEPCCVSEKSIQWCSVLYGVQCNANWSLNEVDWQIMLLIYCSAANWANRHLALVSLLSATELFLEQGEASLFSSLWEYWKMTARGFLPFFPGGVLTLASSSLLLRKIVPQCLMHPCSFRAFRCNPLSSFVLLFFDSVSANICMTMTVCSSGTNLFKDLITYNGIFMIIVLLGILIIHSACSPTTSSEYV